MRHIVHQLALAQVMVTRAGLALREAEFTKPLVITGEKYHMTTPKIAPALTAYEKLERAWRRLLIDFERNFGTAWSQYRDDAPYEAHIQSDTSLDPDTIQAHHQTMPTPPEDAAPQPDPSPGTNSPHEVGTGLQPAQSDIAYDERDDREGDAPDGPNAPSSPVSFQRKLESLETQATPPPQVTSDPDPDVDPEQAGNNLNDTSPAPSDILARAP